MNYFPATHIEAHYTYFFNVVRSLFDVLYIYIYIYSANRLHEIGQVSLNLDSTILSVSQICHSLAKTTFLLN